MNMEAPTLRTPASIATPGGVPVEDLDLKGQEDIVRKFAAALGKPKQGSLPKETIAFLLSKSLTNQDVVLKVPSFDIQVSEESGAGNPLPGVGETSHPAEALPPPPPPGTKPSMSASVLTTATQEAADLEQNAARSIGSETSWTKSTILYARDAILTNIAESFNRFTDSRLRSWTLLLLRHSLSTGDESSRSRLLGILSASLHVSTTFTNFKVLPMPPTASSRTAPNTVILPLLFDATLDISMKDKMESVTLRTPGTISTVFMDDDQPTMIKSVEISLDSGKFLKAMVEQVRIIVLKAVATATKTSMPIPSDDQPMLSPTPTESAQASLSTFRSMLNLSPKAEANVKQDASLLKARSSALKLNSVLRGDKSKEPLSSPLGLRKNRSVHWDSPAQIPSLQPGSALAPQPKKSRRAQTAAKLKSFKSFGRPHAGDFGSGPRNATFGEFSRAQMWGRDGRMAHHPMPMQKQSIFGMLDDPQPRGNAKFQVPSSVRLTSSFQSTTTTAPANSAGGASTLPRSATVLENILLKKASGGL